MIFQITVISILMFVIATLGFLLWWESKEADELSKLLKEAKIAMEAFTDPEGNMPEDTGEFRDLKRVLNLIERVEL